MGILLILLISYDFIDFLMILMEWMGDLQDPKMEVLYHIRAYELWGYVMDGFILT